MGNLTEGYQCLACGGTEEHERNGENCKAIQSSKNAALELTRLQSEVERLRGRCGELESNIQQFVCSGTGPVADAENKFLSAVILRKQAEAVEACEQEFQGQLGVIMTLSQYAQRLRQQAAESENG